MHDAQVTDVRDDSEVASAVIPLWFPQPALGLFSKNGVDLEMVTSVQGHDIDEHKDHWKTTITLMDMPRGRVAPILWSSKYDLEDHDEFLCFFPLCNRDRLCPATQGDVSTDHPIRILIWYDGNGEEEEEEVRRKWLDW